MITVRLGQKEVTFHDAKTARKYLRNIGRSVTEATKHGDLWILDADESAGTKTGSIAPDPMPPKKPRVKKPKKPKLSESWKEAPELSEDYDPLLAAPINPNPHSCKHPTLWVMNLKGKQYCRFCLIEVDPEQVYSHNGFSYNQPKEQ